MEIEYVVKKTAVVFGGTGLVGSQLINQLIESETYEKIIAVLRTPLAFTNNKLEQLILPDFSLLSQLKEELKVSDYFCCIGTTIKKAGSKEAFKKIDFGIPVEIARLAEMLLIPNFVIISSIGANASSANFYLKTKGEMEKEVRSIYNGNIKIIRPSLLMGNRDESRPGEKVAVIFMILFECLFFGPFRKYKGIKAIDVAKSMLLLSGYPREKVFFETQELVESLKKTTL